MDAMERKQVITCDIPGAFLLANWLEDNDCYLKFEGLMVKMICETDPNYRKYFITSKTTWKENMYGKLTKAMYGTVLGSILFYRKLSSQLYECGYEWNPYDPCNFNKTINKQPMIIQFYVNNFKCSHMEYCVLDDLVKQLNDVYRTSKKELFETKGGIHKYLGLTIDFSGRYGPNNPDKKRQVIFTMYHYIEDITILRWTTTPFFTILCLMLDIKLCPLTHIDMV